VEGTKALCMGLKKKHIDSITNLMGAYTTGMSHLTLPDYYNGNLINPEVIETWKPKQIFKDT